MAGLQSNSAGIGISGSFSYTQLFPIATWNSNEVDTKYYYCDINMRILIFVQESYSIDLLTSINLLTRMKIIDGSYKIDDDGNELPMEDVTLSGGIIKNPPRNLTIGIGLTYYLTPHIAICGNVYGRTTAFKYATSTMGENIQINEIEGLDNGLWDNTNCIQISTKFLVD